MHNQLFFFTNEDKICRHSSIKEMAGSTLISNSGVHTKCTTIELLFGHPLFGYMGGGHSQNARLDLTITSS
jgi:hypothetical protein